MNVTVEVAVTERDYALVRQHCRDFVDWLLETFPEQREQTLTYFEPTEYEKTLAALPEVHARPKGQMLLAKLNHTSIGCIMYKELEPGVAEMKRLFVDPNARGTGAGKALVNALISHARDDGYSMVKLDTAKFLTDAIELYRKTGFTEAEPSYEVPEPLTDVAYFMQRSL